MRKINNLFSRVYAKAEIKPLYVLGLLASPRSGGNCDTLLDRALAAAEQERALTRKIRVNDLKFTPCQACPQPSSDGLCLIADDFQQIYQEVEKADIVILASPVYFGSISAQAKMMIDRFQCHWLAKKESAPKYKRAGFICVQAQDREDFFANCRAVAKNFFATIDAQYSAELFCSGWQTKDSAQADPDKLNAAAALGRSLVREYVKPEILS